MSRMKAFLLGCVWLLSGVAGAVTDQDIETKFAAMADYQPAAGEAYSEDAFAAYLKDLVADLCIQDEEIDHLEALTPLFLYHPDTRKRMLSRLDELLKEKDVAGARAAEMALALRVRGSSPEAMADVVKETLGHPGIGDSIRAGRASDLFTILRGLPPEALEPNAEAIALLGEHFDATMSRRALVISSDFLVVVRGLEGGLGKQRVREIHAHFNRLMAGASSVETKKTDMQDVNGVVNQ